MKVHSIEFSPKDFWNKLNTRLGNWVQLTMMIDHDDWKLLTSNKVNNLNWYLIRIQPFRKFKLSFLTYSSTYSSGSYSYSDFITFGWSAYIGCFVPFVCYGYNMVIKSVCRNSWVVEQHFTWPIKPGYQANTQSLFLLLWNYM